MLFGFRMMVFHQFASWNHGNKSLTFGMDTTLTVWKAIEEHLLLVTKAKEIFHSDNLMTLKKVIYL